MNEPIYTVMTFSLSDKPGTRNSRVVGFYHNFEDADESVKTNSCDINEYSYDYALVEKVNPGLYPETTVMQYYKFNYNKRIYEPIAALEELNMICNFTIG